MSEPPKELTRQIEREEQEKRYLEEMLQQVNSNLRSLYTSYAKWEAEQKGEKYEFFQEYSLRKKSIPDHLEDLLRKHGPKHVDELKYLLFREKDIEADKQTISGALIRYTKQKRRFKRVGSNVFDLLEREED